jgi:hypothetical protein
MRCGYWGRREAMDNEMWRVWAMASIIAIPIAGLTLVVAYGVRDIVNAINRHAEATKAVEVIDGDDE